MVAVGPPDLYGEVEATLVSLARRYCERVCYPFIVGCYWLGSTVTAAFAAG